MPQTPHVEKHFTASERGGGRPDRSARKRRSKKSTAQPTPSSDRTRRPNALARALIPGSPTANRNAAASRGVVRRS